MPLCKHHQQHICEALVKQQWQCSQSLCCAGIKDIDKLVERFMEAEDANFSLFNYVNEVNAEVEKLEDQIGDIKVGHNPCPSSRWRSTAAANERIVMSDRADLGVVVRFACLHSVLKWVRLQKAWLP